MRMLLGSTTTRFQRRASYLWSSCIACSLMIWLTRKKRITRYMIVFKRKATKIDIPQVKKLAVLITNLLVESSGDEVDKVKMIPFEIEQAQGLPKTKHPFNCGIFLVKILECQSLKIGDMTKINDDNALELRRTLSCEIFNQFVDESFGK
uniref:Ubiquitin-like protease family profile domain-containing protein n=1 Tax=Brassica campestris TaxID=3711 RepID=A0A3P5YVY6_BRACM|nr:unnamed protein product [Brassica rapa]